jgi:hypothetical protein
MTAIEAPTRPPSTSYAAVHWRLRSRIGHAGNYDCIGGCGNKANQWAYDHKDPEPLTTISPDKRRTVEHSADPTRYAPMCYRCHANFDHGRI